MLTAAALAFAVNLGGAIFNWIFQKVGRVGTQIVLFVLATAAALWYTYGSQFPGLGQLLQMALVIFSLAVAFYEVLLKYFPMFSGPTTTSGQ
jgi:hypothetical protein